MIWVSHMRRRILLVLITSAACTSATCAEPLSLSSSQYGPPPVVAQVPARPSVDRPNLGGGFIQFVFGGGVAGTPRAPTGAAAADPNDGNATLQLPSTDDSAAAEMDPRYEKQTVAYSGGEKPGTIIIDTRERFLYLVETGGTALRYGVGVGRPGFTWSGVREITMKRAWPDWRPPDEMLKRRPDLPTYMAGGPQNPLGARAMYLGSSLYRIHGSNEPWTIGTEVSSGCIRMRNEDVIDLYDRVKVGTKVVVI